MMFMLHLLMHWPIVEGQIPVYSRCPEYKHFKNTPSRVSIQLEAKPSLNDQSLKLLTLMVPKCLTHTATIHIVHQLL